jgi:hypothetical protein
MVRWELRSRDRLARPTKRVVDGPLGWFSLRGGAQTGGAQAWSNTSMTRNGNQVSVFDPVHAHPADSGRADWRFCWSGWVWACQDLNLGPHPYQQSTGNRCAAGRFRRSHSTVGAEVMCSPSVQLNALPNAVRSSLRSRRSSLASAPTPHLTAVYVHLRSSCRRHQHRRIPSRQGLSACP